AALLARPRRPDAAARRPPDFSLVWSDRIPSPDLQSADGVGRAWPWLYARQSCLRRLGIYIGYDDSTRGVEKARATRCGDQPGRRAIWCASLTPPWVDQRLKLPISSFFEGGITVTKAMISIGP